MNRFILPALLLTSSLSLCSLSATGSVSLTSFGARPNDPSCNSVTAFQQALGTLGHAGGGTLSVPAGDYYLQFPDIADNVDPKEPASKAILKQNSLTRSKLILVPAGVIVTGTHDAAGHPTTRLHWTITSAPLLSFVSADHAGIVDIAFVFDGSQPQFFPWAEEDFLDAVGYRSRWLGGPYELSTVIYTIGSGGLRFENLSFRSGTSPADNEHTFAFGIMSKGKTPVPQPSASVVAAMTVGSTTPGGGLTDCVSGNAFRSLSFEDYVMGIVASGQCDPIFENISGDNRGSWYRSFDPTHETGGAIKYIGPPGHLIYLTFQNAYDVLRTAGSAAGQQVFKSTTRNKNISLRNIIEGPHTLSNVNSLGTLALKNIDGGLVANVTSNHPAGLIQTMVDAHKLTLQDLTWSSDADICSEGGASACGVPIIGIAPGPANTSEEISEEIQFVRIKLHTVGAPTAFRIAAEDPGTPLSGNIQVDDMTIECQPLLDSQKQAGRGTIMLRSFAAHLANVTYHPIGLPDAQPRGQAYAVRILARSLDTNVDIQIRLDKGSAADGLYKCEIEKPAGGMSPADTKCVITAHFVD